VLPVSVMLQDGSDGILPIGRQVINEVMPLRIRRTEEKAMLCTQS